MSTASAPGKLVLCGEYAVLEGYPAVVAAVDVRARARFAPETAARLVAAPLMAAVITAAAARGVAAPGTIVVDTAAFGVGGRKLGLGSSAAAATAAAALLVHAARGELDLELAWQIARDAHRTFQRGGSGVDVAAATFGGVVRFTTTALPTAAPPIPAALEILVVDTGSSTSTQRFVDRVFALPDRAVLLAPIAAAAAAFLDGCARNDVGGVLRAVDDARGGMAALGTAAAVDIVSAPHARVAGIAAEHGGAAKPSGAGGGDVAVAFVPTGRAPDLRVALAAAGLAVVDLRIGAPGACIEP